MRLLPLRTVSLRAMPVRKGMVLGRLAMIHKDMVATTSRSCVVMVHLNPAVMVNLNLAATVTPAKTIAIPGATVVRDMPWESRCGGTDCVAGGYGGSEEPQREYQRSQSDGLESRRPEEPSYSREPGYYGGGDYEGSCGQHRDRAYGEESYGGRYRELEQGREQETYGSSCGDRGDNEGYRGERHEECGGYRAGRDSDDDYGNSGDSGWEDRNRREERSRYQELRPGYRKEVFRQGHTPAYGGGYGNERCQYGDEGGYDGSEGEGGYSGSSGVENLSLGEEGRTSPWPPQTPPPR